MMKSAERKDPIFKERMKINIGVNTLKRIKTKFYFKPYKSKTNRPWNFGRLGTQSFCLPRNTVEIISVSTKNS